MKTIPYVCAYTRVCACFGVERSLAEEVQDSDGLTQEMSWVSELKLNLVNSKLSLPEGLMNLRKSGTIQIENCVILIFRESL